MSSNYTSNNNYPTTGMIPPTAAKVETTKAVYLGLFCDDEYAVGDIKQNIDKSLTIRLGNKSRFLPAASITLSPSQAHSLANTIKLLLHSGAIAQ